MFRTNTIKSFSTRNRKQTKEVPTTKKVVNQNKKKVPIVGVGGDLSMIKNLTVEGEGEDAYFKLIFNPQENVTFLNGSVGEGSEKIAIVFNVFLKTEYNDIVKNNTNVSKVKVYLEKLTLKQTSASIDCKFLPFVRGSESEYVSKVIFYYTNGGSAISIAPVIDSSIVTTLQVVNMESNAEAITPVAWNDDLNQMPTLITTITGNYEKLRLTNFRYPRQELTDNITTNLVVKKNITKVIENMKLPIEVTEGSFKWQITSINKVVNTGDDNNTKLIGIDNVLASGAVISTNDSSISFLGIQLTEQQKTEAYWKDFYVNKITRYSDQVFESGFKFQGYRGTDKVAATEVVVTIAPATGVSINDDVLTINFGNEEPGFLGETEEINLGSETNPNNVEAVAIYLDENMSAQVRNNMNDVSKVKLLVSSMRVITQQTEPNVDCFVKRVVDDTAVEPTYVAVYYLNTSNEYNKITQPIVDLDETKNLIQEITNLNVIYGAVVEEGEDENKKKLLTPATVPSVWINNKLNLETVTPKGINVTIGDVQTTNCLYANAKLNLVVQGEMPFDWYEKWLPLDKVYVKSDGSVEVNPTPIPTDLPRLYSINNLPDYTANNIIGIKTSIPESPVPGSDEGIYSWMDMTRLADFTSVEDKILNEEDSMTFLVDVIKVRKELSNEAFFMRAGTNGDELVPSITIPIEMTYSDLITKFEVETGTSTKSLVITFKDQTDGEFLEPKEGETSKVLDISNNEDLSKALSQSLKDLETGSVGPEILCLNKLRLIRETGTSFTTNFYTSSLQSIEIRYLKYVDGTTQGIVGSYVINTANSAKKIVNRVNNLIVIQGKFADIDGVNLLEPINAQKPSSESSELYVFEEGTGDNTGVYSVKLDTAYISSGAEDYIIPEIKAVKGVNILVPQTGTEPPSYPGATTNIVVKGEIPSWVYKCLDTTNDEGQLNTDINRYIIKPTSMSENKKKPRKAGETYAVITEINGFPDEDIGINNGLQPVGEGEDAFTAHRNENGIDLSNYDLEYPDPKLTDKFFDNVMVSPSTTADVQMQFTRHVGLETEGSFVTIKQAQGGEGIRTPVDDPLVPLIESVSTTTNIITFNIKPNDRGTLLVQNRVNYGSTDSSKPEQPGNIVIDLTDNKELSKGMKNWQNNNGTAITFTQEAVVLQDDKWTASENPTSPDVRLNGDQKIDTITIKWYDEGNSTSTPAVEPSYKSVTFRMTPTSDSDEQKLINISSTINKLYLVNGTIDSDRCLTSAYQAVDKTQDETTINGIFKKTGDDDNPVYSIEGVPELENEPETAVAGHIYLYSSNVIATGITETPTTINVTVIKEYQTTNIIYKASSQNNLAIQGNIPKWAFEQFDDKNLTGYSLIQQEGSTDKWTITNKDDANVNATVKYVNALPVNEYGPDLDIGIRSNSYLGYGEPIDIENESLIGTNFRVSQIIVRKDEGIATVRYTGTYKKEYHGSMVTVMGGEGNVSSVTEQIKSFSKETVNGEDVLVVTFKPSTERNILKDYRVDGAPTNIMLDVTGDMNLCKQLSSIGYINKVIIRQEALIVSADTNTTEVNMKMNGDENVEKITINFFGFEGDNSTGRIGHLNLSTVTHQVSKLYFVYGDVDNHLLKPLAADNVFIVSNGDEVGSRTFYVSGMKQLKVNLENARNTEVNIKCEEGCLKDVYATNVINAIAKPENSEDKRDTNIVVYGEIPYEIYRDFQFAIDDEGNINPSNENSVKYPITAINDFPCIGYGDGLDIGIGVKPQSEGEQYPVSVLKMPESAIPDNNNDEPVNFGKEGFYVDDVDFTEIKKKTEELQIMFTSHRGFRTIGSKIKVKPKTEGDGDGSSVMKVKSLNDLYNMMMEPRKYKHQVGLLRSVNGNLIQIPDGEILDNEMHLYYLKNKVKGKDRLVLAAQQPTDYVQVYVIGDKGLTNQEDCVPPEEYMVRLVLAIKGTVMDNDFSMQIESEVVYMKNINYGVVGNGAFEGSSVESIEVKGNKFNLKIEDIMNSICVRTLDEDTMEKTIKEKTEDVKKTKKIEMTKYIQYMKRVFQTMAYNKRYINEVLGYLSKCVSFEKTRLPSIREDNQGLESVSSEWSETNPNGWIEKFNEDFTQGGINYKVVSGYDYNYKFRDEGKHADLVKNMEDKLKGIYMFSLMEKMSETDSEGTADNEYALMKMIDELIAVWLEYYKGVVTPDDDLLNQYSEIEIYEDEEVYKIFEATEEGETKVITCLTGGNEDEQSLETFIQGILEFFKDEIKTIVGRKEDINGFDIEEFVAYEDPMKGKTEDMISEAELNKMFQEDDNNLIEYSQMLSTIQGERNKLQRQGNKNKFILKFTQTYKGTFFELLGKETKNTDDDSIILGFFMSELKNIVSHERKRGRGYIPDKVDNKRFVRITKVPEFYKGDPLDWINDNYYCNKIFTQSCDNLYLGLQPEIANRITVKGTPDDEEPTELKEKDMIGYYMIKVK